ncbi:MAG: 16S rRNA (adenine(1518)-N(6)/adenine(1519)-N(6))-dimethyltransferase RsmA [Puniceicoccales bacterium]|jgi:16S rRNA (adenine1518-N6/adenine1519-N6)-dimethyltransferase|nr:16S rRNA (adenine(1518)-N(6)/adenine(1519)-N(6))-dimethyltransferase RsmA [Puniceicoccales bacterium]
MEFIPRHEPLSWKQTQFLLAALHKSPQKKWGQNFLIDKNIVLKSLEFAQLSPNENVIEIGPGLGTLTRPMLGKPCRIFAIECDAVLCTFLKTTFADVPHFQICLGDAVAQPLAGFSQFDEPFKVVANLPYNIATPWMNAILEQSQLPQTMTLMLQKEAAYRFFASPDSKALAPIAIFLTSAYRRTAVFPVARHSFSPIPKVDSVIIHLERLPTPKIFRKETKALIRRLFTQRRKQMGTLIKTCFPELLELTTALCSKHHLTLSARPEQLPLPFWWDFDVSLTYTY